MLLGALLLTSREKTTSPASSMPSILGLVTSDVGLLASIECRDMALRSRCSLSRSLSLSRSSRSLGGPHDCHVDGPGPGGAKVGNEGMGGGRVGLAGEALGGLTRGSRGSCSRTWEDRLDGDDDRRRLVGVGFIIYIDGERSVRTEMKTDGVAWGGWKAASAGHYARTHKIADREQGESGA
jgi:hypothetical protein